MKKAVICAAILAAVLLVFVNMKQETEATTTFASVTSASIQEKEQQIKDAQREKEALRNSLASVQQLKKQLEAKRSDMNAYIQALDEQLAEIEAHIDELNAQIEAKEAEIAHTLEELEEARNREIQQYEAMVQRIQYNYEQGDASYVELLLYGDSLAEMLSNLEYVEQVAAYDSQQLENFIINRQFIEVCEAQLEIEKELLDETKESVLAEKETIEAMIEEKRQTLESYNRDIASSAQSIAEYEADIKEQDEIVKALEAAVAEEKKRLIEQNGTVLTYDGGVFKFPLASYTRISDPYGNRTHPILKVPQFHNGTDFAAPTGTAIYAAYDGIVVAAAYSSSMGNYIMIDHGNELYTIYMHASKLYVSKGDIVTRGETIAAVGSTGRSTGPHLHFSVRLNGSYVDPMNYLTP